MLLSLDHSVPVEKVWTISCLLLAHLLLHDTFCVFLCMHANMQKYYNAVVYRETVCQDVQYIAQSWKSQSNREESNAKLNHKIARPGLHLV